MTWLGYDAFKYHKVFKEMSVLHYEYADEEKGTIPNIELDITFQRNYRNEIINWCVENIKNEWFWDFGANTNGCTIDSIIFYFEKRIDATTFRLIWG